MKKKTAPPADRKTRKATPPATTPKRKDPDPTGGNVALLGSFTVLDHFAGQALASMLSAPVVINDRTYQEAARLAYRFGAAMIEERRKSQYQRHEQA